LIELAPSYFRYMDATASKATVLAKLIGFYTIEIRNLETGAVQSKADLLVMENLFYDQKIVKTFDLKGIQGRKVKSNSAGTAQNIKTLFDGEWIEGTFDWCIRILGTHLAFLLSRATTHADARAPALQGRAARSDQERRGVPRQEQHHGLLVRASASPTEGQSLTL
jgi:hypothetical protein